MPTSSYITVKNALEQFAENHLAIKRLKTSFFEQIDNFSSSDNTFPILYVVPSDVTFEQYTDRFFFRIYCVDILQKDRSNESAILNDTLLTLRDLYNWLKIADNGLNILSTARAIPVNNFLVDYTAGWYLDVEVEGLAESNDCSIPFSNNFNLTGYTCDYTYATSFLTCETLEECAVIIDLQNQIDAIVVSANTFVIDGSYDNPSGVLTLERNDGELINITGFTTGATGGSDIYVTGGTFNAGTETLTLGRNDNQFVEITGFTSGGIGFDVFVTGGTYDNGSSSILFTNNTGGTFSVTGITASGGTGVDTYVTGYTYNNANTFTISQNQGQSDLYATINIVTGLTTDYFDFNIAATVTPQEARLTWNDTDGTLDLGLKGSNVTLQIGQEQVIRVVNKTGAKLLEANYQVVRVRTQAEGGAQGQRLAVLLAQANTKANHTGVLGLVTEDISNNEEGFITTFGLVRNINTTGSIQGETWLDGDIIWLSESVAGGLTNVLPTTHPIAIGYVVYAHINQGKIFVKVDEGVDELNELHDVDVSGATDGQVLTYSAASQTWVPTTISGGTSGVDVYVSGGTYSAGTATFTNTTGGTFNVTGWTSSSISSIYHSNARASDIVSGNTLQIVRTVPIPAGTLQEGDVIRVSCTYTKPVFGNAASQHRWYIGPDPTNNTGAANIFYNLAQAANRGYHSFQWKFGVTSNTTLKGLFISNAYFTDLNQATAESTTFTIDDISSTDLYFHYEVLPGQAGISAAYIESTLIEIFRSQN